MINIKERVRGNVSRNIDTNLFRNIRENLGEGVIVIIDFMNNCIIDNIFNIVRNVDEVTVSDTREVLHHYKQISNKTKQTIKEQIQSQ